jgi:hypothetical protein
MLKQTFDRDSIAKLITPKDVWTWGLWSNSSEQEVSLTRLVKSIQNKIGTISPLAIHKHRGKNTYQASCIEDSIKFRNLDRCIRRIYKVKQSDRNKIIGQIKRLLGDNGNYKVLRLDIEKCYESINFDTVINKLSSGMILSPENIIILRSIQTQCNAQGVHGLPRGLCFSPTLTELFLEKIDKSLAMNKDVIYVTRYVDDYFLVVEENSADEVEDFIKVKLQEIGLSLNQDSNKYYKNKSRDAEFVYLGYKFCVFYNKKNSNDVKVTISEEKLNRIKTKLVLSFNSFKKDQLNSIGGASFNLLKQRINYISVIKSIKQHDSGDLLGGIAFNYSHVSDRFECLKPLDGFYNSLILSNRFLLSSSQRAELMKKSLYGYVSNGARGVFTRRKVKKLTGVWKNA